MELTSPAFGSNQPIPDHHTNKGEGVSPALAVNGAPASTKSLALVMHDPDAPNRDFVHWLVWNIPPHSTVWPENTVPPGAVEGTGDYGRPGYGQPAPPSGTHRYMFDLYALDALVDLSPAAGLADLQTAITGHTLATAQLIGTVTA